MRNLSSIVTHTADTPVILYWIARFHCYMFKFYIPEEPMKFFSLPSILLLSFNACYSFQWLLCGQRITLTAEQYRVNLGEMAVPYSTFVQGGCLCSSVALEIVYFILYIPLMPKYLAYFLFCSLSTSISPEYEEISMTFITSPPRIRAQEPLRIKTWPQSSDFDTMFSVSSSAYGEITI